MTLEQKVAQLFIVTPEALVEGVSQVTQAGDMTREGVTAHPVGGIVYFAQNLLDPEQTTTMLANVKQFYADAGNVAPFIAVDEEGGTVVRVADNEAFGAQDVGDASALGSAGDTEAAKRSAEQIADYLMPRGFNMDFAPVADVVDPLRSDTMGLRSFSSDAAVAADMVRAEVEGFRDKKMLCCAKHFPGIGAAAGDSHEGAITIEATNEELETVDLVPFRAAIEAGVPMIMVGHGVCRTSSATARRPRSARPSFRACCAILSGTRASSSPTRFPWAPSPTTTPRRKRRSRHLRPAATSRSCLSASTRPTRGC